MKAFIQYLFLIICHALLVQTVVGNIVSDSIPSDLPLPKVSVHKNTADGYIFAALPYWGNGSSYLVIYDNTGRPVSYRKMTATCTDFKRQDNGLLTYYDYASKKFFGMDSSLAIVDSFWVSNGFTTDEHDIKILRNGHVLLIGYDIRFYDMSQYIQGGDPHASVIVNVIQEIDNEKNVVFEWKAYEHYKLTDVGPAVNLSDQSFVHTHINSIDIDQDDNLIISTRNLDEITKIDRKTGTIMWRWGGKNNQFTFVNDSIGFSAQHSVSVLPNGNLLVYDNGLFHQPPFSRASEYRLDAMNKTATMIWSYRNTPDVASMFWGNAQRLENGNTFISWGLSEIAVTEVNPEGGKVFEMSFPKDVFSYRVFRFPVKMSNTISSVGVINSITDVTLHQNYPNPFNPTTMIEFSLAARTQATLKIFDLLGREIATLLDEERNAGRYKVKWDARTFSSGIYFYRLKAGDFVQTKKLLLVR